VSGAEFSDKHSEAFCNLQPNRNALKDVGIYAARCAKQIILSLILLFLHETFQSQRFFEIVNLSAGQLGKQLVHFAHIIGAGE
jgi:hypothetical protein